MSLLRGSGNEVDLVVGLHAQEVRGHVFHRRQAGAHELGAQTVTHGYCVGVFPCTKPGASLGAARRKAWAMATAGQASRPLAQAARDYARQIYPPVLRSLWAETVIGGRRAGAITSNRSYAGDVWFSSWFNPVRSSYGLYHYGVALGEHDWVEMARATRTLVLSAPAPAGLFPTVFVFGPDRWVESHHQGGGPGIFHVMDMSWTMYQLLRWHAELEPDDETIARARSYARALVGLQRPDGGLPAYVDGDGAPVTVVDRAALLADVEGAGGDPYVPAMLASVGPKGATWRAPRTPPRCCSWLHWPAFYPPAAPSDKSSSVPPAKWHATWLSRSSPRHGGLISRFTSRAARKASTSTITARANGPRTRCACTTPPPVSWSSTRFPTSGRTWTWPAGLWTV